MYYGVLASDNPPFFRQTIYSTNNNSKVQIDRAKLSKRNFRVTAEADIWIILTAAGARTCTGVPRYLALAAASALLRVVSLRGSSCITSRSCRTAGKALSWGLISPKLSLA